MTLSFSSRIIVKQTHDADSNNHDKAFCLYPRHERWAYFFSVVPASLKKTRVHGFQEAECYIHIHCHFS